MAASDFPNSYKDPLYASLDARTEAKLGLPAGLLSSIRLNGEKSNNDQVSEASARSPYQFIPSTRKAIVEKYGIDPLLSPENASEAAGLLLKEGLDRNKGDTALAVAEYHAGPDRKGWGPRTKAYVSRVTSALGLTDPEAPAVTAKPALGAMPDGSPSTFDRVSDEMAPAQPSAIANIYEAYRAGKMSPEQTSAFEADVNAGKLMLPRGAALKGSGPAAANDPAANIVAAYNAGKMSADQRYALEADVQSGKFKVPGGLSLKRGAALLPGSTDPGVTGPVETTPEPSLVDKAIGTGEAALQTVTGATGGAAGMLGGVVRAVGEGAGKAATIIDRAMRGVDAPLPDNVSLDQAMAEGAHALTYQPRTSEGQRQADVVGGAMQNLIPVAPLVGTMGPAGAMRPLVRAGGDATRSAVETVKGGAANLADAVRARMPGAAEPTPTPGTMASAGAAGTDMAAQRRAAAADLPVPMELTKGQATRDQVQQSFEKNVAHTQSGDPLLQHFAGQNEKLPQNFEAFIDSTGAQAPNMLETGRAVNSALVKDAARAKTEYRAKYRVAEKAGELEEPVSLQPLADYLNSNRAGRSSAPILGTIADELKVQGVGDGALADGSIVAGDATLKQAETVRKAVNKFVKDTDPNDVRVGSEIKGVIDQITEGKGGQIYQEARKARQRYAQLYEDNAVVADLLGSRKGTSDRKVALENVFNRTILNGTREDLSNLRRTLQVSKSEEGAQAWRELQGATLRHLLDEATKGAGTDIRGNPIFSAAKLNGAVRALEKGGKLDFILSKRGAQQVRDLNDLSKVIFTAPPGSVNTSNTANVVMAALTETAASGLLTGLPVPLLTGLRQLSLYSKDRALRARVADALAQGKKRELSAAPRPTPMRPAPRPATMH